MLKDILDHKKNQVYREFLYARGFFITDRPNIHEDGYPFYNQWQKRKIDNYWFWLHKNLSLYTFSSSGKTHFLIGHAYNPFSMLSDEVQILEELAHALSKSEYAYWAKESELTGVFVLGWVQNDYIVCSGDAACMLITYYGTYDGYHFISSFSKLVDDIVGLKRHEYIDQLIQNKFYRYFGFFLPGDLSPFVGLNRLLPNHFITANASECFHVKRYYPTHPIITSTNPSKSEYETLIADAAKILENNMGLIARKWPHRRAAISLTGGKDSTTTLACSRRHYDKFSFFSYISAEKEAVDAYAARDICAALDIPHQIYEIPQALETDLEFQIFSEIMEYNYGCIGISKKNEIQKRIVLSPLKDFHDFDIEVKSWVDEITRARYYTRYNKKHFPLQPTPRLLTTLYKIFFLNRHLASSTDKVFADYLTRYYGDEVFEKIHWCDLIYWEFLCSSGEGLFLTAEQKISYDITIPYNNRLLLEKMLSAPLERRINDDLQKDIILHMDRRIADTGISVLDVGYGPLRTIIERIYLEIHSRLPF